MPSRLLLVLTTESWELRGWHRAKGPVISWLNQDVLCWLLLLFLANSNYPLIPSVWEGSTAELSYETYVSSSTHLSWSPFCGWLDLTSSWLLGSLPWRCSSTGLMICVPLQTSLPWSIALLNQTLETKSDTFLHYFFLSSCRFKSESTIPWW